MFVSYDYFIFYILVYGTFDDLIHFHSRGLSIRTIKSITPVLLSLIRNRNGRSQKKRIDSLGTSTEVIAPVSIATFVTAATSVPSSFTSTNVFCMTSVTTISLSSIFKKPPLEINPIPAFFNG